MPDSTQPETRLEHTLQTLIQTHGYWVIPIGAYLEGETILLPGGFAAHRGCLERPWVMIHWRGRRRG